MKNKVKPTEQEGNGNGTPESKKLMSAKFYELFSLSSSPLAPTPWAVHHHHPLTPSHQVNVSHRSDVINITSSPIVQPESSQIKAPDFVISISSDEEIDELESDGSH